MPFHQYKALLQFSNADPAGGKHLQQIRRHIPQIMVISSFCDGDGILLLVYIGAELGILRDSSFIPQIVGQSDLLSIQTVKGTVAITAVARSAGSGQMHAKVHSQLVQGVHSLDHLHSGHLLLEDNGGTGQCMKFRFVPVFKPAELECGGRNGHLFSGHFFYKLQIVFLLIALGSGVGAAAPIPAVRLWILGIAPVPTGWGDISAFPMRSEGRRTG